MITGQGDVIIIEAQCTKNAMCLNYPKTILPRSLEKLSSTKLVPRARKVGDS